MKKKGNMAQSKEQNKSPQTDTKEVEVYELPNKEFKILSSVHYKRTQIDN